MEVTGKIKKIDAEKTFGTSFKAREIVIVTNEQYPQPLLIQFVQDKCSLLDKYKVDEDVKISINLRGKEWINPEGVAVYFNTIQGWRIEKADVDLNKNEHFENVGDTKENEDLEPLPF